MSGSVFDVVEALDGIIGFSTSKNSAYGKWLLSNSELGQFARNIIRQHEEAKNKAKEKA